MTVMTGLDILTSGFRSSSVMVRHDPHHEGTFMTEVVIGYNQS